MADVDMMVYPTCCTSAFCGRLECTGCRNLPVKQEFDDWRKRTNAVQPDENWCPTIWRAAQ